MTVFDFEKVTTLPSSENAGGNHTHIQDPGTTVRETETNSSSYILIESNRHKDTSYMIHNAVASPYYRKETLHGPLLGVLQHIYCLLSCANIFFDLEQLSQRAFSASQLASFTPNVDGRRLLRAAGYYVDVGKETSWGHRRPHPAGRGFTSPNGTIAADCAFGDPQPSVSHQTS